MRVFGVIAIGVMLVGCSQFSGNKVAFSEKSYTRADWDVPINEAGKGIKTFTKGKRNSTHVLTLTKAEKPHVHDRHDLMATVLSGKVRIHFKDRYEDLSKGDVAVIPKGTYHWAENKDSEQSEIFVVFTPGFDGKDRRFVD